jgi:hypothetical protein
MTVNLSMFAGVGAQLFDDNGSPLSGGKLYSYTAGTTTPRATYTTSVGNVAHTNPIILDSAGRVPSGGEVWLTDNANYKFVVKTSADVTIATYDNVQGSNNSVVASQIGLTPYQWITATDVQGGFEDVVDVLGASGGASEVGFIQGGTGAVASTVQTQLRAVVTPEQFGALGDGVTDDTAAFTAAVTYLSSLSGGGGGTVLLGPKIYRIRDWTVPYRVNVTGSGLATRLRFLPSGNDSNDSTSYVIKWTGAWSTLESFRIDGTLGATTCAVGNGLQITADLNLGMQRTLKNVEIHDFAGYRAAPAGGTYGVNSNYSRADITDDIGGHLLTGGNGIVGNVPAGYAPWNLVIDNVTISMLDGIGINFANLTDSKITNIYVGNCVFRGLILLGANNQFNDIKVYLCNRLNVRSSYAQTITLMVPHQSTLPYDFGAVQLGGPNYMGSIEAQENASVGIVIGLEFNQFRGGVLDAVVDGNGGVDTTQSAPVQAAYRRPGMVLRNYWDTNIRIASDDLRSKEGYPRQTRAFQILVSTPLYGNISGITAGPFYKINNNGGGADFTPLQLNYATTSNAVGFVFQARRLYPAPLDPATNFGTGNLTAPNGKSIISATIMNQYNQDQGLDGGYDISGDYGDSVFTINGQLLKNGNGAWNGSLTRLGSYNFWVDATGDLRIKSGTPSSDTDGTVVGTQT